jgi:hypothetical protein
MTVPEVAVCTVPAAPPASRLSPRVMAGHDAVIKARDSVDVTATKHDVRLKAERNFQALAGNSGCGGIHLETRAVCPAYAYAGRQGEDVRSSGIVMLAPNSQILGQARDVVFQTEPGTVGAGENYNGRIILDAGASGALREEAKNIFAVVGGTEARVYGAGRVNEFSYEQSLIGTPLRCKYDVYARTNVIASGWLVAGQSVAAGNAVADLNQVLTSSTSLAAVEASVDGRVTYLNSTLAPAVVAALNAPAGTAAAEFSLRTDPQYMTFTGWQTWEGRWQMMARLSGQTMPVWNETVVLGLRSAMVHRPYPGGPWFNSVVSYAQQSVAPCTRLQVCLAARR